MIEHDGCVGCKYEHEDEASPHCDKCTQNSTDKYTPVSNADRIRGMSDEELANWTYKRIRFTIERAGFSIDEDIPNDDVVKSMLDWLRQPAETEGKG